MNKLAYSKHVEDVIRIKFTKEHLVGFIIHHHITLLLLLLSLSPLYRVFTRTSPRQTMSLGDTLLQILLRFTVNTLYGAHLPRSYVGSDGLLRQHFPENVCSA